MLIDKENVQRLIPQRPPFVMIDSLIHASENGFSTEFRIDSSNVFLNGSILSESSLIENIAQTCAAGFGYLGQQEKGGEPKIGYIGAVTNVMNTKPAVLDDLLETEVVILNTFDSIHLVEGRVRVNGEELLSCQLKIVLA